VKANDKLFYEFTAKDETTTDLIIRK